MSIGRGRNALPVMVVKVPRRDDAAIEGQHAEHDDEQRQAHGRGAAIVRRIGERRLPDRRGDDVDAAGNAQHEGGGERAQHLGEDEQRGAQDARHHQRQGDGQHGAQLGGAHARAPTSSSAGSIDFIEAEIMTKATVPSNSAITQAMPKWV